eukprot:GILI01005559.1.p2 GENE.GILI01005559.1~~GILI01005559.1.p2  ORF type:complete len:192 (-),score=48.06 GILI01005559.1:1054-1629(-)
MSSSSSDSSSSIAPAQRTCSSCGKSAESMKSCGSCHNAFYCSRDCQRAHWPTHKPLCVTKKKTDAKSVEALIKEVSAEIQDSQRQVIEVSQSLNVVNSRIGFLDIEKRKSEITISELNKLPPNTNTWKAVGKAFLMTPSDAIQKEMQENIAKSVQEKEAKMIVKETLEKKKKEAEQSFKELIDSYTKKNKE